MSIIGFTGTQMGMTQRQIDTLDGFLAQKRNPTFLHGDCIGADEQAHKIALMLGLRIGIYPCGIPNKRAYCGGEGVVVFPVKGPLDRNRDIVRAAHYLIAAPKGNEELLRSGTWATVRFADTLHKQTLVIWPDGRLEERHPD